MNSTNSGCSALLMISLFIVFTCRWILERSTVKSKSKKDATPKEKLTFRVTGIPATWDRQKLQSFLKDQRSIADVSIESLAYEEHNGLQVATVTFENALLQHSRSWSIPIPSESNDRKDYLTVDKDFYGMTTLYMPPQQDYKIE